MRGSPLQVATVLVAISACSQPSVPPAYRDIEVPRERLTSQAARERGRALYLDNCALCHGERADGEGRRKNLSSRPADFTQRSWREKRSPREVFYLISEGVDGTAMASWDSLGVEERWDLVAYLLSVAEKGAVP